MKTLNKIGRYAIKATPYLVPAVLVTALIVNVRNIRRNDATDQTFLGI